VLITPFYVNYNLIYECFRNCMFAKNYAFLHFHRAIREKLQHIKLWKFAVFRTSCGTSSLPSMNKIRDGWVFRWFTWHGMIVRDEDKGSIFPSNFVLRDVITPNTLFCILTATCKCVNLVYIFIRHIGTNSEICIWTSSCLYVSAWFPQDKLLLNLILVVFYKNMSRNSEFGKNWTILSGT
jgi:hypothetical protein